MTSIPFLEGHPRVMQALHSAMLAMEIGRVPLVVGEDEDIAQFAQSVATLLGGTLLDVTSAYPCSTFISTLDGFGRLCLFVEDSLSDDLYRMIRDYSVDRHQPLRTRFGEYDIDESHRLLLFFTCHAWARLGFELGRVLQQFAHLVTLSGAPIDREGVFHKGFPVFAGIEDVIGHCDRYYPDRQFLFRGQREDWKVLSSVERLGDQPSIDAAVRRLDRFAVWLRAEQAEQELSDAQIVAAAQHFGLPTPFIDLTRVARVAAFFATHGETKPEQLGVVYVFHEGELRKALETGAKLEKPFGDGLIEPTFPGLRRIRMQQGLFADTRGWLVEDYAIARLYFKHDPDADHLSETTALPREFVYPRPSKLEQEITAFLIPDTLTNPCIDECDSSAQAPTASAEAGGLVVRTYLDASEVAASQEMPGLFSQLDGFGAVLALTSSHWLAFNLLYWQFIGQFSKLISEPEVTGEAIETWSRSFAQLKGRMHRRHPSGTSWSLSTQDIVDGLAFFLSVRQTARNFDLADIGRLTAAPTENLVRAYNVVDYLLGRDAARLFPTLASFALNTVNPVRAFVDAVREVGLRGELTIDEVPREAAEQHLASWTGHNHVPVDRILGLIPIGVVWKRRITSLKEMRQTHADEIAKLGPNIDKIDSSEVMDRLMPPLGKIGGGKVILRQEAGIPPEVLVTLDRRRSLAEGIAGTAPAQVCPHRECPWHTLRTCSALTTAPPAAATCPVRAEFHETVSRPLFDILSRGQRQDGAREAAPPSS